MGGLIWVAHGQPIIDSLHSWCRPRGNFDGLPFIPIVYKAFQNKLAATWTAASSGYLSFERRPSASSIYIHDGFRLHTGFDRNIVYNPVDPESFRISSSAACF